MEVLLVGGNWGVLSGLVGGDKVGRGLLRKEQKKGLKNELLPMLFRGVENIPEGYGLEGWPEFGGSAPGPNIAQQLSLAGMEELASGGYTSPGAGLIEEGRSALSGILGTSGGEAFEDYFRTNIEDPLMESLNRPGSGLISTLKKSQVGSGNLFGGAYHQGLGELLEGATQALAMERAAMQMGMREQVLRAVGLIPGMEEAEHFGPAARGELLRGIMETGDIFRMAEMDEYESEYREFLRRIEEARNRVALLGGTILTPTKRGGGGGGGGGLFGGTASSFLGSLASGLGGGVAEAILNKP